MTMSGEGLVDMRDAGNELAQERKQMDGIAGPEEPARRRLSEGGLNLKPSGRVHTPSSLEQRPGDRGTVGQVTVDDAVLSARDVNVYYGGKHALKTVSIDVARRQGVAMIGPSRCAQ